MPPNSDYKGYHTYIEEVLPPESPYLYGLHPNAEIEFLTTTSESLFRTVLEMQPRDSGASDGTGVSRDEKVRTPRVHCYLLSSASASSLFVLFPTPSNNICATLKLLW